jgi:hypothetical protein
MVPPGPVAWIVFIEPTGTANQALQYAQSYWIPDIQQSGYQIYQNSSTTWIGQNLKTQVYVSIDLSGITALGGLPGATIVFIATGYQPTPTPYV